MPAKMVLLSNAGNGIPNSSTGLNLYVSQIPPTYNSSRLRDVFSTFGPIQSVKIMYDPVTNESRCFGFVLFERVADAHRAMMSMNGVLLEGSAGRLHVRVANPSALPVSLRGGGDNVAVGAAEAPARGPPTSSTAIHSYPQGGTQQQQQQPVYHSVAPMFAHNPSAISPQQQPQSLSPSTMAAQPSVVTMDAQHPQAVYCFPSPHPGPTAAAALGQFVVPHPMTSNFSAGFAPLTTMSPPNFAVAPVPQLTNVALPSVAAWSPQPTMPTFYATHSPLVQVCLTPVQYVQQQTPSHSSGQMDSSLSTSGSSMASLGGAAPSLQPPPDDLARYSMPWA